MSRYSERFIKCSDAIEAATDVIVDHDGSMSISYVKYLSVAIEALPSIDLVRCKECKHRVVEEQSWGEYNEYCDLWCDGNGYWASVNADDFCSYGERREP